MQRRGIGAIRRSTNHYRREFITLLGGAAAAWPLAARAQQSAMPVIGLLHPGTPEANAKYVAGFRKGLAESGYVEGRNVAVEYRWGYDDSGRLRELAADLTSRRVAVVVTPGSVAAALAAKAATATIPIVFRSNSVWFPVSIGLVAILRGCLFWSPPSPRNGWNCSASWSPARPLSVSLSTLRIQLPNPRPEPRRTALALGLRLPIQSASSEAAIDAAFASFAQQRVNAVMVGTDAFFGTRHDQLVGLTARHAMPAIYYLREAVAAGGLMSYGTSATDGLRLAAAYAGRILKGEKPGDLPIQQTVKFELGINLKTAKALGLDVPPSLLARADEVIE